MKPHVKLSLQEVYVGASAGIVRRISGIARGGTETNNCPVDGGWQRDIEGALAEMALAKHFGLFWSGIEKINAGDVGEYEVKHSSHNKARLLVPLNNDRLDNWFWLVTGLHGSYTIHGCMLGRDAMQERYVDEPVPKRPCYCVPQSDLKPTPEVL